MQKMNECNYHLICIYQMVLWPYCVNICPNIIVLSFLFIYNYKSYYLASYNLPLLSYMSFFVSHSSFHSNSWLILLKAYILFFFPCKQSEWSKASFSSPTGKIHNLFHIYKQYLIIKYYLIHLLHSLLLYTSI